MTIDPAITEFATHISVEFVLTNEPKVVPAIVSYLQQKTVILGLSHLHTDGVGIALEEAITNGIHHGNLEVSSELRQGDGEAFFELVDERRRQSPYRDRRVRVRANYCRKEAVFEIRDEGQGFSLDGLPDPKDPANLEVIGGRGILLMRAYMDEVHYNDTGNEVRLVKRRHDTPGSANPEN